MTGNRSKFKFGLSVALVFSVGALAGVLGASLYFETRVEKMFHGRPPHGERILNRLTRDLDLTPTQQEEIRPIITAFDKQVSELKERFRPHIKALHDNVTAQIRTRLDDEQKIKFDEINKKLEQRFRARRPSPPSNSQPSKDR